MLSGRLLCANSGHCLAALRMAEIDPKPSFPLVAGVRLLVQNRFTSRKAFWSAFVLVCKRRGHRERDPQASSDPGAGRDPFLLKPERN